MGSRIARRLRDAPVIPCWNSAKPLRIVCGSRYGDTTANGLSEGRQPLSDVFALAVCPIRFAFYYCSLTTLHGCSSRLSILFQLKVADYFYSRVSRERMPDETHCTTKSLQRSIYSTLFFLDSRGMIERDGNEPRRHERPVGTKRMPFAKLAYRRYIRSAIDKSFPCERGMHEANLTREIHDARWTVIWGEGEWLNDPKKSATNSKGNNAKHGSDFEKIWSCSWIHILKRYSFL